MTIYTRKINSTDEDEAEAESTNFLYLTCDLPPAPLFKNEMMENIIPQVCKPNYLKCQFIWRSQVSLAQSCLRSCFVCVKVNLFTLLSKFNGATEREYNTYKDNLLKRFKITKLPPFLILYIRRFTKNTFFIEKNPTIVNFPVLSVDFGEAFGMGSIQYDLIANIVHEGQHKGGTWRMHLYHKANNTWYELQDLHVKEILPQMLTLTEPYIQIYQRHQDA